MCSRTHCYIWCVYVHTKLIYMSINTLNINNVLKCLLCSKTNLTFNLPLNNFQDFGVEKGSKLGKVEANLVKSWVKRSFTDCTSVYQLGFLS